MPNRLTRPGLGHLSCTILAALIAALSIIAGIWLTAIDDAHRAFPNTIVGGVDVIAGTSLVTTVVLLVNWWAQTRVLTKTERVERLVTDLLCDMAEIKGGLWQINNAQGRARVYQSVDREAVTKVLATAATQRPDELSEREWKIYMSGIYDGQQPSGDDGPSSN